MYVSISEYMNVGMYGNIYVPIYLRIYVRTDACMYVREYIYIYIYICVCVCV